ncbi:MAG: twin-arginine translocase subunit TatC [Myxococcota bacterium]
MRPDPVDEARMPLLDHLRELRLRLIRCAWTLLVTFVAGFVVSQQVFDWLAAPMEAALAATGKGTLAVTEATEGVFVQMKVAGLVALFASSPVLFWQSWQFVGPGLYEHEKRAVLPLVAASTVLFTSGAAFAYYVVFRFGFPFFLEMNGENVTAVLSINSYLGLVTTLFVAFGLSFQLPVVVWFLARMGLVDHLDLIRGFRYGVVGIFVVAAVLTPGPDLLSQLLMAAPLLLLYGIGIVVARFATTKKR